MTKLQPRFGRENLNLKYMDCVSSVLGIRTQSILNNLKKLEVFLISVIWRKIVDYSLIKTKEE